MSTDPVVQSTPLPRYAAIVVLFLTLGTCTLQVLGAVDQLSKPDAPSPAFAVFLPPVMTLLVGIGISAVLDGLARLLEREPSHISPDLEAAIAANNQLLQVVAELRAAVQASVASRQSPAPAALPPMVQSNLNGDRHLQRVVLLLEQLNETAKRQPTAPVAAPATIEAQTAVVAPAPSPVVVVAASPSPIATISSDDEPTEEHATPHELVQSEPTEEDSSHPDPEPAAAVEPEPEPELQPEPIQELEPEPEPEPVDAESADLELLQAQLEELMGASDFDAALIAVNHFAERYPHNTVSQQLVQHIVRESEVFVDRTTVRLFEEIRANVERRQWRRALDVCQQLLTRFPEHPRSGKIRLQLRAIQHNAEIEERQVQDSRIQDLIKARRFAEAIDLSEDLIRRFPNSSQAANLTEMLPRLRERSGAHEGTGSGVFAS